MRDATRCLPGDTDAQAHQEIDEKRQSRRLWQRIGHALRPVTTLLLLWGYDAGQ